MTEPHLELAPYELPPHGRRDEDGKAFFIEANLFGEKRTFTGRSFSEEGLFENILCFAVPDEPQHGHFVCAQSAFEGGGDWVYPTLTHSTSEEQEILIERIESEQWGRYFVLDANLNLAGQNNAMFHLFLCSDGRAMARSPRRGFACFRWSQPCAAQMWETPYHELHRQIISVATTSDEIGFPFRWASMLRHEHYDLAYPLRRGTYAEWTRVCELRLLALDLWGDEWQSHELQFSVGLDGKYDAYWYPGQQGIYKIASDTPFHLFAHWSSLYFSPTRNDELCSRYFCVADWANGPISIVRGNLTRPTQHERLESLLQLREWLADKATPEEIETLLSED